MRAYPSPRPTSALVWRVFFPLVLVALILTLGATLLFDHSSAHTSLFTLSNLVGPTTDSLVHHNALLTCTDAMGTPGNPICFHSARMPIPSLVVALGYELFGNHYLAVGLFKSLLLFLPLALTLWVVSHRLVHHRGTPAPAHRLLIAALLLIPFLLTPFLADVVNLQVEEGYAYSLLALAFALVIFPAAQSATLSTGLAFGLTTAALYLSKSSLLPAAALLACAFVIRQRHRPGPAVLALTLVLLAPAGWLLWQHHASGQYTLGTSLDGINFHKGNNPAFLEHYPPAPGENLDQFDSSLTHGFHFRSEWQFDSFHREAALLYIEQDPADTAHALLRKFVAIFFTVRKLGSEPAHGAMRLVETAGLLLFRLLFWTALLASCLALRPRHSAAARFAGASFLLLVAAVALPYLAGFAYTRHVSILIYPSALLCVRLLLPPDRSTRPQYTRPKLS